MKMLNADELSNLTPRQFVRYAKRQARMMFQGIAFPTLVDIPDDRAIDDENYVYRIADRQRQAVVETVFKFNRTALRNAKPKKTEKADPRFNGGEDRMILPVGKPGSRERVEAMASQYAAVLASGQEISIFREDD